MKLKYVILGAFLFHIFLSCNLDITRKKNSDTCRDYYQFVLDNWTQGFRKKYQFKENPDLNKSEYFNRYIHKECLLGLKQKDISKIFGTPTREMTRNFPRIRYLSYCMKKDGCVRIDNSLIFKLDEKGSVIDIYVNMTD